MDSKKLGCNAGILGGDLIHLGQNIERPKTDVPGMADGRGCQIKTCVQFFGREIAQLFLFTNVRFTRQGRPLTVAGQGIL